MELVEILTDLQLFCASKVAMTKLKSPKALLNSLLSTVKAGKSGFSHKLKFDILDVTTPFMHGQDLELCFLAWLSLVHLSENPAKDLFAGFVENSPDAPLSLVDQRIIDISRESDENTLNFCHSILVSLTETPPAELLIEIFNAVQPALFNSVGTLKRVACSVMLRWFYLLEDLFKRGEVPCSLLTSASVLTKTANWIVDNFTSSNEVPKSMVKELFVVVVEVIQRDCMAFQTEINLILKKIYSNANPKVTFELLRFWPYPLILLEASPAIFSNAFASLSYPHLESCAVDFINSLTRNLYAQGLEGKFGLLNLLINGLKSENLKVRKSISDKILPIIGKSAPKIYEDLITLLEKSAKVESIMPVYLAAKMNKINLNQEKMTAILSETIVSSNPQLRYSTFSYLVLSIQSAKDVKLYEIDIVKKYLIVSGFGEQLSMRQEIRNQMLKLLESVERSRSRDRKDITRLEKKFGSELTDRSELLLAELRKSYDEKSQFLNWFLDYSLNSLFPGSSLHRIVTSTSFLKLINEVDELESNSAEKELNTPGALFRELSRPKAEILFFQLFGSTAGNEFMDFVGSAGVEFTNINYSLESKCLQLLKSIRVSDVDSGLILSKLLISNTLKIPRSLSLLEFYESLIGELEKGISNYSILEEAELACRKSPLNGLLSVLLILVPTLGSTISTTKLTKLCQRAIDVTLFAVSRTEGDQSLSQILQRDCFRSVSLACSLLYEIGNLTEMNYDYIAELVHYYTYLMTVVRHPGAFSSIENNLGKICRKLGDKNGKKDQDILQSWLSRFLRTVQSLEVSVTRRSAGIPTAILSVIIGSSKMQKPQFISETIEICIKIITDSRVATRDERIDMIQVHALNIVRTLLDNAELVTYTDVYIERGFMLCLQQFASAYFPIRNCAAMLFSVLISKALGARKSKSNFEQLTTAAKFFGKYPNLYPVLLDELKLALKWQRDNIQEPYPSLVPILNLLSKLETAGQAISMEAFEELLFKFSSSRHWVVRQLAAHTISLIAEPSRIEKLLTKSVSQLCKNRGANEAHGVALQFLSILSQQKKISETSDILLDMRFVLEEGKFSVARGILLEVILVYGMERKEIYLPGNCNFKIDELQSLAVKSSFMMLQGCLSTHFSPSSYMDIAANIAFSVKLQKESRNLILEFTIVEDSQRLQSVLGAVAKLPNAYFEENDEVKNHLLNISLSIIKAQGVSSYLIAKAITFMCLFGDLSQLQPDFNDSFLILMRNPYAPDELVEALFLMAIEVLLKTASINCLELWESFVSKSAIICNPDQSKELRLYLAKCLNRLLPSMQQNNPQFVNICVLIDTVLGDDDEDIGKVGADTVANFLHWKVRARS